MSAYTDPEIVIRVRKSHHAGLIVASPDSERVVDAAARLHRTVLHRFPRLGPAARAPNRLISGHFRDSAEHFRPRRQAPLREGASHLCGLNSASAPQIRQPRPQL